MEGTLCRQPQVHHMFTIFVHPLHPLNLSSWQNIQFGVDNPNQQSNIAKFCIQTRIQRIDMFLTFTRRIMTPRRRFFISIDIFVYCSSLVLELILAFARMFLLQRCYAFRIVFQRNSQEHFQTFLLCLQTHVNTSNSFPNSFPALPKTIQTHPHCLRTYIKHVSYTFKLQILRTTSTSGFLF